VNSNFAPIGQLGDGHVGENSFWPSFTDIMMVITMIFLMATSLLVVRNWQLVSELKESVAAEQMASVTIETTVQENATLEERLANAEQSNSILRLRALKKEEELRQTELRIREQKASISRLNTDKENLRLSLLSAVQANDAATLEINRIGADNKNLSDLLFNVENQLAQQKQQTVQAQTQLTSAQSKLTSAQGEIAVLTESSLTQQQNISGLTQEKQSLNQSIEAYNQEILALKGEYEVVKSKYEELIKPARSAKGKYIAEVYYVKGAQGDVIRYKQPGQPKFTNMTLIAVEKRLDKLKKEHGRDLYVKIIIPENSGLTYNEAWSFMRKLLVKYDYYYQEK
jgi:chromosome segregation ATPase